MDTTTGRAAFYDGPYDGVVIVVGWPPPAVIERSICFGRRTKVDRPLLDTFSDSEQRLLGMTRWFSHNAYPYGGGTIKYVREHVNNQTLTVKYRFKNGKT